jgi:anti-sigma factor RsiW
MMLEPRIAIAAADTVSKDDLHAFADGALTADRATRVAQYIDSHEDAAALIDRIESVNRQLRAIAAVGPDDPTPERLLTAARRLAGELENRAKRRAQG